MRSLVLGGMLLVQLGCASHEGAVGADAAGADVSMSPDAGADRVVVADAPASDVAPDAPAPDVAPDARAPDLAADLSPATDMAAPDAGAMWRPAPGTSWQLQLSQTVDTTVDAKVYDIDLFDVSPATIDALHGAGRVVVCYFSAGSHEDWRPDASMFPAAAIGKPLDGWPGERWLDTRSEAVRTIMKQRLDRAVAKRCDGVDPDNVDGYTNGPGFPLTADTQLDYNRFLAREAHARGLAVGLKNDLDQVGALASDFDWALNESCLQYDECDTLAPFIRAGKAVFHVEYGDAALADKVCPRTKPLGFSTLIKKLALDAWRIACP